MVAGKDRLFFFVFLNTICACGRGDASLMTGSQSGVEAQQRLPTTRPSTHKYVCLGEADVSW